MMDVEKKAARNAKRINACRRSIMISAHTIADMISNLVGDYQIAMSIALKFVYACRKSGKSGDRAIELAAYNAFMPESVAGVPAWAIKHDFVPSSADDILFYTINSEITKETEKAVQVDFETVNPDEDGYVDHHTTWVAKSIMAA